MPVNPKKSKPRPKTKAKTPKKKSTTIRPRRGLYPPPINKNTNSVRVHIINAGGAGDGPAPKYMGPDRGSFAFNPVFDMGFQKPLDSLAISIPKPLDVTPLKRVSEIQTQTGIGLGLSTKGLQTDTMLEDFKLDRLRKLATDMNVPFNKKTSRIQLIDDIKTSMNSGKK